MSPADDPRPGPNPEDVLAWMDQVAAWYMQQAGWPPIMGRTMAWLMVCEPEEQTAAQIAEAVHASRASLTTTLRLLTEARMVQTVTRAGERAAYYRLTEGAWSAMLKRRLESMTSFVDITSGGLRLFPDGGPRAARMREAHRLFQWLNSEAEPMWKRWDAVNRAAQQDDPDEDVDGMSL